MLYEYEEILEGSWFSATLKGGTWRGRLVLPDKSETVCTGSELDEVVDYVHVKYSDSVKAARVADAAYAG